MIEIVVLIRSKYHNSNELLYFLYSNYSEIIILSQKPNNFLNQLTILHTLVRV